MVRRGGLDRDRLSSGHRPVVVFFASFLVVIALIRGPESSGETGGPFLKAVDTFRSQGWFLGICLLGLVEGVVNVVHHGCASQAVQHGG